MGNSPAVNDWQDVPNQEAVNDWQDVPSPKAATGTISAIPPPSPMELIDDPVGLVNQGLDNLRHVLLASDHPFSQEIGQHLSDAKELLLGGQSVGKPEGTKSGLLNNPATAMLPVGPEAAEGAAGVAEEVGEAASKVHPINAARNFARKVVLDPVTGEPTLTPTTFAKRILRDPKEVEAAAYEQKAQALMERGYEQAKLDMAHEQKLQAIEDARQKQLADIERLRDQEARALMQRGKQTAAMEKAETKAGTPKIVTSDRPTARVGSEGRGATWKTEDLYRMIQTPDMDLATKREAIQQLILRGKELPPNARYIMGDARYGAGTYNPREVTKFTPEGTPIKQGGKKLSTGEE